MGKESKNVNLESVQKAHRPERAWRLHRLTHRRIEASMENCENSLLPLAGYIACTIAGAYETKAIGKESLKM